MQSLKSGLYTLAGCAVAGVSALNYKLYQNRKLIEQMAEQEGQFKDDTRAGNEGFGINWGLKADLMIMETMDTGDLIFTKRNCEFSTTVRSYLTCLKNHIWPDQALKFDEAYIAIRKNPYEVDVLGDWSEYLYSSSASDQDKSRLISYQTFLRSPLYNEVALRKL